MEDIISKSLKQAQDVLQAFVSNPDTVSRMRQAVDMLAAALENGNKILSCGNGGSLCDAAHFAEELKNSPDVSARTAVRCPPWRSTMRPT